MGYLARRRSLLIKLVVVLVTAWFTIAFLLYSENRTSEQAVAFPWESNSVNENRVNEDEKDPENLFRNEDGNEIAGRAEDVFKKEIVTSAVLAPPNGVAGAGEMGKPVVLPANLTGEFKSFFIILSNFI